MLEIIESIKCRITIITNGLPTYNISDSVKVTTEWYHRVLEKKEDPITVTDFQIEDYMHENNWS